MSLNSGSLKLKRLHWLLFIVVFISSAAMGAKQHDNSYGTAEPRERLVKSLPPNTLDYWSDVKPVIDQRCVVCHGCYDAPCQLKMSSIEGIVRGANSDKVYDSTRLHMGDLTRLFEDAQTVTEWRNKGFYPIVSEYKDSPKANRNASVMYQMLKLKKEKPLPGGKLLSTKSFDLSLNRKQSCTKADEFDKYASKHPLGGMPYALPGLSNDEQKTLMSWVEQGAVHTARAPLPSAFAAQIKDWEKFLNGSSLKQQLTARYIYEHLSYAHLYFPSVDEQHFFTMVRSSTPPGQAVKIIATRLPYTAPGVERVYYRIQPYVATIVDKTHMPYRLDAKRMQRWQSLFIDADYKVTALPTYNLDHASNPFQTFAELPVEARHKFLLDEAEFTIMAFIKGPVCRGQVALDVIDDNFWVFFTDPNRPAEQKLEEFLAAKATQLDMPASGEASQPVQKWHQYQKQQTAFLASKNKYLAEQHEGAEKLSVTLDGIWDGNGVNDNASLTVYRHHDNATVEKGMLGQAPKTAWLIDYTLLERIHYLLVAGYDVYGKLGHQIDTRLYMDFLRMEGESNFLLMLPAAARTKERDYWYRGAKEKTLAYLSSSVFENNSEPGIKYQTDHPKLELYGMLRQRLKAVLPTEHDMASVSNAGLRQQLERLNQLVGKPATTMPEDSMLQVNTSSGPKYFTLLRNSAHSNMSSLKEAKNRLPNEDTLTVLPGFIGAYPNAFFVVDEKKVASFVDALSRLGTEADYAALLDDYGIRRTNKDFWSHSDAFHAGFKKLIPLRYGILDYSRFENR